MLRTLAINSNKKCVKFWCFDSFLITKANLRLRRVIWNPWQSNGKLRNMKSRSFEVLCHKKIQNARTIPRQCVRIHHRRASGQHIRVWICTWLPPFTPGCTPPFRTRLPPTFHPDVHVRNSGSGWERRRFNLSEQACPDLLIALIRRASVANISDYPDHSKLKAECCVVPWCYPEASWYLRPTSWDICDRHLEIFSTNILGYFALDICFLNPQSFLVIHLS